MRNPVERSCFSLCRSCYRCADKGTRALCSICSGRPDPRLRRDPYDIDDRCRCTEGVLQYRTKIGMLVIARFPGNPFAGQIRTDHLRHDEQQWESYVDGERERFDDSEYDPVRFANGQSTLDWTRRARAG